MVATQQGSAVDVQHSRRFTLLVRLKAFRPDISPDIRGVRVGPRLDLVRYEEVHIQYALGLGIHNESSSGLSRSCEDGRYQSLMLSSSWKACASLLPVNASVAQRPGRCVSGTAADGNASECKHRDCYSQRDHRRQRP